MRAACTRFPAIIIVAVLMTACANGTDALMLSLMAYDIETTGLDVATAVIDEIGVQDVHAPDNSRDIWINIGFLLPQEIADIQHRDPGYPMEVGKPAAEALTEFFAFTRGATLVGHNIERFDHPFLRAAGERVGLPVTALDEPFIDTFPLAACLLGRWDDTGYRLPNDGGPMNFKLETLATYLGIAVDREKVHNALYDARVTTRVVQALASRAIDRLRELG